MSGIQSSTQVNQSLINSTAEKPGPGHPTEPETHQQVEFTQLKDSPILRQISALMDMIATLQGQISTLSKASKPAVTGGY